MASALGEIPDAVAAYAVGVGAAVGRGGFYALVFLLVVLGIGLAPVGLGLVLVVLGVVLPAAAAAVALVLPGLVRERLGAT